MGGILGWEGGGNCEGNSVRELWERNAPPFSCCLRRDTNCPRSSSGVWHCDGDLRAAPMSGGVRGNEGISHLRRLGGGRGIDIGRRGARRGIGGICERIHIHIRVRVLVGFIFLFASTFMNFHRSQKAFIPGRAAGEGDGVRGALPAHHFCLTVPFSQRRILHPDLLTRGEDGRDSSPCCNFCVRCLSLLHHCIRI